MEQMNYHICHIDCGDCSQLISKTQLREWVGLLIYHSEGLSKEISSLRDCFYRTNRTDSNFNTVQTVRLVSLQIIRIESLSTYFVRTALRSEVKLNVMNGWVCAFVTRKDLPSEISNLEKILIFVKPLGHYQILTLDSLVTDRFHFQF